jgi:hypothetical protein
MSDEMQDKLAVMLAQILTELQEINQTLQAFKAPNAKPASTRDIYGYGEDK